MKRRIKAVIRQLKAVPWIADGWWPVTLFLGSLLLSAAVAEQLIWLMT